MGEAELIEDRRALRLGCDTPRRYLDERALFACDDARNPAFSFAGRAMGAARHKAPIPAPAEKTHVRWSIWRGAIRARSPVSSSAG
jgi:hypothetical protein